MGWILRSRGLAGTLVVLLGVSGGPQPALAVAPQPFPADPAALRRAEAIRTLPCGAEATPVEGFAPEPGLPPVWRVAGATVSVRRAGPDRFAFVLSPPDAGQDRCAVRDVLVLPARGTLLQCALPDGSSRGLGVHTQFASGRRDVAYWQADAAGGLHRLSLDEAGLESDTGDLICSLPEVMP